ncbi:vitamin-D-receptor interacting mediator subunit 4-domain-containing protein [Daldinia caldariorum]|uniref:vitamin-D-receptor interacting mediator subunit 4-domain-containing protein n=1 Tax=Daldinia caldariorum TaxID=326644 RepID=UPI0020082F20|nr:vitamin-D-receptor interacting mediator subunit 4-domain-containing protein [Daldinia caldariorum]KAI1470561.1 vitamin-D-receptor interacting mediator subunit 4-domain-containing protein [Daldinia caldariorum]
MGTDPSTFSVQTHQSNYRRIQDLRAATTSFDTQIKETLRLLANTRKELVNAPATVFPSDRPSYDIDYDELLAYASRISKTTIPPAGAANGLSAEPKAENSGGLGTETAATTPAAGTPNGALTGATTPANVNGAQQQQQQQDPASQSQQLVTTGAGDAVVAQDELPWKLNPFSDVEFVPWPSEESVRKGALATLAFLSEKGVDPENYDPEEEKARKEREKEEQQAAEERERQEREERERRAREEQARLRAEREKEQREAWRRASVTGGPGPIQSSPVGEKKQFQFMADDDEDDDE